MENPDVELVFELTKKDDKETWRVLYKAHNRDPEDKPEEEFIWLMQAVCGSNEVCEGDEDGEEEQ